MNNSFNDNAFSNLYQIYFQPEIDRRIRLGLLRNDSPILAAQVIIFADLRDNISRLNDEVVAKVKIKEGVNKEDPNFDPNCEDVEKIEICEEEYLNCGHITMIQFKNCRLMKFDFIYNKMSCENLLNTAFQFLETATMAFEKKYKNSCIENAFAAAELLAKTNLLLDGNNNITSMKTTNHKAIRTHFSTKHRSPDDFGSEFKYFFNKLSNERGNARYLDNQLNVSIDFLQQSLTAIRTFYDQLASRLP